MLMGGGRVASMTASALLVRAKMESRSAALTAAVTPAGDVSTTRDSVTWDGDPRLLDSLVLPTLRCATSMRHDGRAPAWLGGAAVSDSSSVCAVRGGDGWRPLCGDMLLVMRT